MKSEKFTLIQVRSRGSMKTIKWCLPDIVPGADGRPMAYTRKLKRQRNKHRKPGAGQTKGRNQGWGTSQGGWRVQMIRENEKMIASFQRVIAQNEHTLKTHPNRKIPDWGSDIRREIASYQKKTKALASVIDKLEGREKPKRRGA